MPLVKARPGTMDIKRPGDESYRDNQPDRERPRNHRADFYLLNRPFEAASDVLRLKNGSDHAKESNSLAIEPFST